MQLKKSRKPHKIIIIKTYVCRQIKQGRSNMGIARELKKQITDRLKPQKVMLIYGADTVRMIADKSISNYKRLFDGLELLAIDEAQHIPEIGMKLKLMVDEIPGLSIIATGSSSFDLQNQAGEPLVGRCTR